MALIRISVRQSTDFNNWWVEPSKWDLVRVSPDPERHTCKVPCAYIRCIVIRDTSGQYKDCCKTYLEAGKTLVEIPIAEHKLRT